MPSYVTFSIVNNTQQNSTSSGLRNDELYLFLTQETINTAWNIAPATGIATPISPPGTLAPSFTLADLVTAGGSIQVDSSVQIPSARIYISSSPTAVGLAGAAISGPTAGIADFFYDFVEFALTGTTAGAAPNKLNIDTTQVDQLGIPITLQVTPNDPNFSAGSGIVATLDRQTLISNFLAMAVGPLAPFADCVFPQGSDASTPYRLLNPSDVIGSQLGATALEGSIATSGTPGAWQATFTITGPAAGSPPTPPTNGSLSVGMPVSGPLIPAGTTVGRLPGWPTGSTVVMSSTAATNPFTASSGTVQLFFITPPATALATYFDQALDDFFTWCMQNPNTLLVEQNNGGDHTYTGNVVQISGITDINGNSNTYTVLQFTGGSSEVYNLYYPFFSTNASAGKTTPFGTAVPPPPQWWAPAQGLMYYAPPSLMVFGASGVFADNTQQQPFMPSGSSSTVLGAIENVIVTALARGYATTWQFRQGTITPNSPATTAEVALSASTTAGLADQMDMASFRIANIPMTVSIPSGAPVSGFTVSSPLDIRPTPLDLLTFSQFYAGGGTWSAFADFLHDPSVTIGGRAYALPFDDQGGFSSDLNAATSVASPASACITLGPWTPADGPPPSSPPSSPPSPLQPSILLSWQASSDYCFVFELVYSAGGEYVTTYVEIQSPVSSFNGNSYELPVALQTPVSAPLQESIQMSLVAVTGIYSGAVWCNIDVPDLVFEGSAFEFSAQYDGPAPLTIW